MGPCSPKNEKNSSKGPKTGPCLPQQWKRCIKGVKNRTLLPQKSKKCAKDVKNRVLLIQKPKKSLVWVTIEWPMVVSYLMGRGDSIDSPMLVKYFDG